MTSPAIKRRLKDSFGHVADVVGVPVSLPDAAALAGLNPYQFQWWALGLVDARPVVEKKGADQGIDGRIYFHDEAGSNPATIQIIFSVESGHTGVKDVRDLRGVLGREQAEIAVLISLQAPTQPMRAEAASAGFYGSPGWNKTYSRIQMITEEELLRGRGAAYPPAEQVNVTYKCAPLAKAKRGQQIPIPFDAPSIAKARSRVEKARRRRPQSAF